MPNAEQSKRYRPGEYQMLFYKVCYRYQSWSANLNFLPEPIPVDEFLRSQYHSLHGEAQVLLLFVLAESLEATRDNLLIDNHIKIGEEIEVILDQKMTSPDAFSQIVEDFTRRSILATIRQKRIHLVAQREKYPNYHYISQNELQTKVETPSTYKLDEPISRRNFMSFLIFSFAFARGNPFNHWLFFEWVQARSHFDYFRSLQYLKINGFWSCFSSAEQEMFITAFKSVVGSRNHQQITDYQSAFCNETRALLDMVNGYSRNVKKVDDTWLTLNAKGEVLYLPVDFDQLDSLSFHDLQLRTK